MKKLILVAIFALPFIFILAIPTSVAADSSRLAEERLRVVMVDVEYEDISLTDVLADLSKKSEVSIIIEKKIKDEIGADDIMISLSLHRVTAWDALSVIAKQAGLKILFKYGIAWMTTPEYYYEGRNILRIYDVRDLTMPIRNFPGIIVRLQGNSTEKDLVWEDEEATTGEIPIDDLEEIIPNFTGDSDWSVNPGAYIKQFAGMLLIRQAPEVHYEIMALLGQFRMNK